MLNSSVASLPAYNKIAFLPPGWSLRKWVTSSTCPLTMTQQSFSVLCLATSSFVYSFCADLAGAAGAVGAWLGVLVVLTEELLAKDVEEGDEDEDEEAEGADD